MEEKTKIQVGDIVKDLEAQETGIIMFVETDPEKQFCFHFFNTSSGKVHRYVPKDDNYGDIIVKIDVSKMDYFNKKIIPAYEKALKDVKWYKPEKANEPESEKANEPEGLLEMGKGYNGEIECYVKTKKDWFPVTKTTKKRVYFLDKEGNQRYCNLTSVTEVRPKQ